MKSTIRRDSPKASLGDELESPRQQNIPKAKLLCKSPEAKGSRPQRKTRAGCSRWWKRWAGQEGCRQMTWGLAGAAADDLRPYRPLKDPSLFLFFFCFQTSSPAALEFTVAGLEFTVAEGDLDSCLHLLGVKTTGAHYHSLLRDWIFTGGSRSWCVRGNRLPCYLATHFSLCAFLGSLGSSGRSGFTVCSRFTLEHCVVLADFRLEVILLLQPHEYRGSPMCAITSGFCWLFRYSETEGLAIWIRLALNSQTHFSLPSPGVTDACHFRSLTISPHGMKEIGFYIILAGAIQERGENN